MRNELESTWWWRMTCTALAVLCMTPLMHYAGVQHTHKFAEWLLYVLSAISLHRAFSFAGWLIVLCVRPARVIKDADQPSCTPG